MFPFIYVHMYTRTPVHLYSLHHTQVARPAALDTGELDRAVAKLEKTEVMLREAQLREAEQKVDTGLWAMMLYCLVTTGQVSMMYCNMVSGEDSVAGGIDRAAARGERSAGRPGTYSILSGGQT